MDLNEKARADFVVHLIDPCLTATIVTTPNQFGDTSTWMDPYYLFKTSVKFGETDSNPSGTAKTLPFDHYDDTVSISSNPDLNPDAVSPVCGERKYELTWQGSKKLATETVWGPIITTTDYPFLVVNQATGG